jgi:hypothetical protein
MSTKTTFKRIALVAVAALGFGMLSLVSANAAAIEITSTVVATTTPVSTTIATPSAVGTAITATVNVVQDAISTTAVHVIGATYVLTDPNGVVVTSSATFASTATSGGVTASNTGAVYAFSIAISATAATKPVGTVTFTPKTAGVYVLTYTTVNTTLATDTNTIVTNGNAASFYVSGSGAKVASSGIGTTTIGAVSGGQAQVRFGTAAHTSGEIYNVTSSGVGTIQTIANGTAAPAALAGIAGTTDFTQGAKVTTSGNTNFNDVLVTVASTVAGTQTLTWTSISATTGAPTVVATQAITWGATPSISAQYSLLTLNDGAGTTATGAAADTTVKTVANKAGVLRFTIQVVTNDGAKAAIAGLTLGASISGPGTLGIVAGNAGSASIGRSISVALTGASTGSVSVYGDGSSGAAVITITAGGVTLGTKTVTFVGAATKATATQNLFVAKAATQLGVTGNGTVADFAAVATTPALSVEVTDANGNYVASGATVKMSSSDSTKIVVGTCVEITLAPGNFECSVSGAVLAASGASATVTFSVSSKADAVYDIVAAPLTFTVGGAVATLAVTLDKESYGAADRMILSAVAKDSSGNAAFDGQAPYQTIGSNKSVVALPLKTAYIVNGKTATSATSATGLFAPVTSGSFTIFGVGIITVAAPAGAAYSVTATVAADTATLDIAQAAADAAAEATDAANAATDAANAAAEAADAATAAAQDAADAVAALSTQVAEQVNELKMQNDALRKQLVAITNLIIKIQKKVKA